MKDLSINDIAMAKMLMETIVEAGKHGPVYQKIAEQAGKQMRKLLEEEQVGDKVITPAGGPENSQIRHEDGTIEQIPQRSATDIIAEQKAEAERKRLEDGATNTPTVYPEDETAPHEPLTEDPVVARRI